MQLEQKYELLEAIGDLSGDRDQTVPAWEKSTGKQVFVHLLAGGYSAENNVVLTAVGRLAPEHRQHVLGAGDHLGNAYVVTDALPWGVSLRKWIGSMRAKEEAQPRAPDTSHAAPQPVAEAPTLPVQDAAKLTRAGTWRIPAFDPSAKQQPVPPPQPAQPSLDPPEVDLDDVVGATGIHQSPPAPAVVPAPTPVRPVAAPEPAAPPAPAAAPEKEPGEFTRMMRTMKAEPPAAQAPVAAASGPPAAPPAPSGHEAGEFTRLMRAGGNPDLMTTAEMPSAAPAAPAAPESKPGEFTQMIRAAAKPDPLATAPMPASTPSAPPAAPAAPAGPGTNPGEFTQLLRSFKPGTAPPPVQQTAPPPATARPGAPARQEPAVTPPASAGEFTSWVQQGPHQAPPPTAPPPPAEASWQFDRPSAPPAPPVSPPPAAGGQGAFTQMFRGQPQYPQAPAPGMGAPPAAPQAEGEFTRMMRTPAAPGGVFAPTPQGGPADADLFKSPGPAAPKGGPSFTQVISARSAAPPAAPAPAAAAKEAAPAGSKPPYLVLFLVLGLLFLVLIALVLVLVLKH